MGILIGERAPFKTREKWIALIKGWIAEIPKGTPVTIANIVAASKGKTTDKKIRKGLWQHKIEFKSLGIKPLPRNRRTEWIAQLKGLIAQLPEGTELNAPHLAAVSNGELSAREINSARYNHDITDQELGITWLSKKRSEAMDKKIDFITEIVLPLREDMAEVKERLTNVEGDVRIIKDVIRLEAKA